MQTGRRFRLYPTDDQAQRLAQWIGCVRAVYNAKAEEERLNDWLRRAAITSARSFVVPEGVSGFSFDQSFSQFKGAKDGEWAFLHQVPSQLYRNAMYQRGRAWARYWSDRQNVGRPGRRIKGVNDSILLTKELFRFVRQGRVFIGPQSKKPRPESVVGEVVFRQHRHFDKANSVTIGRDAAGRWWLSLNFEDGNCGEQAQADTVRQLAKLSAAQMAPLVVGHDVGIVQAVTRSDGTALAFSAQKLARIARWKRRVARLQVHLARKQKGSRRRNKTKRKIARTHARISDMRNDHAHQVSHAIVDTPAKVLAFEKLNLRGMARRAKPIVSEDGSFAPNGASAKSGLNASLLNASLGKIIQFATYKAKRRGKLCVRVPAKNSSRECSRCGHIVAANRPTQAEFNCQACGHNANADANASEVIKKRAIALLLSVLGRSTQVTFAEAAEALGLDESVLKSACEANTNSRKGSRHLAA